MGSLTNEIGYVNIEDSGNDLYFELDLLSVSTSSTQVTITGGCGYWQRYGPWYLTSGQYVSIGGYSDPSGSPSISTIQSNLNNNTSYYDSYGTRLNSVSDYTFNTSSSSGYYKEAVRCTETFDRWSTNRRIILAGYCDPSASQLGSDAAVVGEYIIPALDSDPTGYPDNYGVIYNPNGGTYSTVNQLKTRGTNLTLNSETPIRTGFTFNGGNTQPDGNGTDYAAGGTYTANAPLYLFAKGTPNTSNNFSLSKRITLDKFSNFIQKIKGRFKPSDMTDYIVDQGYSLDTNINGGGLGRHGNSGRAEAWVFVGGQTTGSNTSVVPVAPAGIFIADPAAVLAPQVNGMGGCGSNYLATNTNSNGTTYIDNYLYNDLGQAGKNFWCRYYLVGRGGYKLTITEDSVFVDGSTGQLAYIQRDQDNTKYYHPGDFFIFAPGETITIYGVTATAGDRLSITVDGTTLSGTSGTLPSNKDVSVKILSYSNNGSITITTSY